MDLEHAVGRADHAVDDAAHRVLLLVIEMEAERLLDAQGLALVERVEASVVVLEGAHPVAAVEGSVGAFANDADTPLVVLLVEELVIAVDHLLDGGDHAVGDEVVEALEDLVDPLPDEGLDAFGLDGNLGHVPEPVLLRALLEAIQARRAEGLLHRVSHPVVGLQSGRIFRIEQGKG